MAVQKPGYWHCGFVLTRAQFAALLTTCEAKGMHFCLDEAGHPAVRKEALCGLYGQLHSWLHAPTRPQGASPQALSVLLCSEEGHPEPCGLQSVGARFRAGGEQAADEPPYMRLFCQKGVEVRGGDGRAVYEDIRLRRPDSYAMYQRLVDTVHEATKPLRFYSPNGAGGYAEVRPPIRVSEQEAAALAGSWLYKAYGLRGTKPQ